MAATELNFGPEWLRALSDGVNKNNSSNSGSSSMNNSNRNNSIISKTKIISKLPSSSSSCSLSSAVSSAAIIPSTTKHVTEIKYRYSKDEMLSYFNRSLNVPVPKDLMQHEEVFVENAQNPLALVELTQEEMNLISQGINSDFVSKKSMSTEANASQMVDNSNNSSINNAYNKEPINHSIRASSTIHTERSKFGTNGFITGSSDRTNNNNNSYSLRAVGGNKSSIIERNQHGVANPRTTLRSTSNIVFTRLSSTDDSIANCPPKSNSVFIAKKGSGLQRSSNNENNSNSSSLFMPSWRSGSLANQNNNINNNNNSNNNQNSSNNETKDWKSTINNATNNNNVSSSEVSKSWRNDIGSTNNSSGNSAKIGSLSHKERKDFFGDSLNENTTAGGNEIEICIGGRKGRNLENLHNASSSNLNKSTKTFNRKFNSSNVNSEQNDLFKSSLESNSSSNHGHHAVNVSHRDHYGSVLDAERDLFGGRNNQTSNYDLFSPRTSSTSSTNNSNDVKSGSIIGLNRYPREHKDAKSNLNNSPNYLSAKLYDRDRSNNTSIGYHRLSHQYDRFNRSNQSNSNNQSDEYDFFVGDRLSGRNVSNSGLTSDDEDYRRNSLPEWSLEDPSTIDVTRVGTFDASGAFHEAFDEEESNFFKNEQNSTIESSKVDNEKTMDHDNSYKTNEKDEKNIDSQMKKLAKLGLETSNDGVSCVSKSKIDYFIDSSSSRNEDSSKNNVDSANEHVNIPVGTSTNVLESNGDKGIFDNSITSGEMKNIGDEILNKRMYSKRYEQNHLLKDTTHHERDFCSTNLMTSTFHENNFPNDSLMPVLKQNSSIANSSLLGETSTSALNFKTSTSSSSSSSSSAAAVSSSSTLFGSLLNTKNNVITSDPQPLDTNLTEEGLKMMNFKLFSNDFAFDFCTSASSTSTSNSMPVMTANNNNEHEMFLQMSTMKNTMLAPVSQVLNRNNNTNNITFINNNNSAIGTSSSFETNNLLNLVDTNADHQTTQAFDQQIFSNILSRSSESPTLAKQSNLMRKEMIKSNSIDETSIHLSSMMPNWLYCDPQGRTQGPFTNQEMYEWYHERYFAPELLVKRTTDTAFIKLGDLIQACDGRCPFTVPISSQPQSAPISLNNHEQSANFSLTSDAPVGTSLFTNLISPNQSSDSSMKTATPNQQPSHSVSMMNQYLTSKTQSTSNNSFSAGTGSFSINDPIINHPFEFYQNMKPNSMPGLNVNCSNEVMINHHSSMNRENNLLANDNHLIDLTHHQVHSASNKLSAQTSISQMANNSDNSMRMFFNNLISQPNPTNVKDDLLAMNNQSREQMIPENYHLSFNKDQIKQTLNEFHINSCLSGANSNSNEMMLSMDNDQLSTTSVPVMSMVRSLPKPALDDSSISKQNNTQLAQPALQRNQTYDSSSGFIEQTHLKSSFQDQDLINKDDPLGLLKYAAANTKHNNTSSNFVLGAISVTDVEELQRREAEERYHSQKQQQAQEESDYIECENEFIEVDRKQKHRQQQNKQNQKKCSEEKVGENKAIITNRQQQTSPPPPVPTPPTSLVMIPQMSQLPKKAVWGNPSTTDNVNPQQVQHQTLSIAEIQKLQEQKDEEDRRTREIQINANIQSQQRSMKWASQPWQEQNNSNVKTLAEIQEEEAEKQATLIRQQETLESIRRRAVPNTSTSTMVAKGYVNNNNNNQTSAWNNNNNNNGKYWEGSDSLSHQLSGQQIVHNNYSNKNNPISSVAVTSINYKNALAASSKSNKIDSGLLRQMLRTNPKVMKKCEDSQLMKYKIDTYEELLRACIDLLNKHFDSIDAPGFISLLKDLGSPNEVSEYCQSYLGNNAVSQCFSKFFITKKSYLFKLKHEQERTKPQQPKKNAWNTINTQTEEPDDDLQRVNNYKSALNNNNTNNNGQLSAPSKNYKNCTTNKGTCNITSNAATSKPKINEDVNIMTMQVESMEDFDKWCLDALKLNFEVNFDAEIFINFLKDIASPDEINDYVQTYFGNNKTSRDFVKYFISKRSYLRNKAKQSEPYEDMCGPAPALTPLINASSSNDNNGFVTVSSSSKKKRNKNKNQSHQNE